MTRGTLVDEIRTVSIVIPVRDAETTIAEQLAALRAQDTDVLSEVIVVDSRSSDATPQIIDREAASWPKLRRTSTDRPGANAARNAGIARASSPGVLLCDADDVADGSWVAAMVDALQTCDVVRGRCSLDRLNDAQTIAERGDVALTRAPTTAWFGGAGGNCAMRRAAWEQLGGFEERQGPPDDVEFFWRAFQCGLRVGYADDAVVHYRLRSGTAELFHQQRSWAAGRARLYRDFRGTRFIERRTLLAAVKTWGWIAVHVRDVRSPDPARRGRWVRSTAGALGRLQGSIRHRVWYP